MTKHNKCISVVRTGNFLREKIQNDKPTEDSKRISNKIGVIFKKINYV